jgi:uroporphyrinogen decarboxylase
MSLRRPIQAPDFNQLAKVVRGEREPNRVHFVELLVDEEIVSHITRTQLNVHWVPLADDTRERYVQQLVEFYYRMGYDYVPISCGWAGMPKFKSRAANDTAILSRGQRYWVDESGGVIKNWSDFERVNWDGIGHDLWMLDTARHFLPDGMKIAAFTVMFELVLERFMGYQDLFLLSYDDPELVSAVFQAWGQKVYDCYAEATQYPEVGIIFHGDDLGFKTGTLMSPAFLRQHIFPWFKRYAQLAHEAGSMYWYHCCGNIAQVLDDLIDDVGIDGLHSFQDVIMPVGEFVCKHGRRTGALGGVDMDKLTRLAPDELRRHVRHTLDECMPGRFALGSGNTVANYVPPENYLAMLDEGLAWRSG